MSKRTPTADELTLRHRDFVLAIDADALKTATRDSSGEVERIPIALSSEYEVERMNFWSDERYKEVLDHSPESVDLSRAVDGLPFLDSHDVKRQLGLIENVSIGADKRLRGEVRFSRRQEAQDLKRDMLDGIRKLISVGYRIDPNNIEKSQVGEKALPIHRIKRWTPFEASSVAIPADPTVGVGRSASIHTSAAHRGQEHTVEQDKDTASGNGAVTIESAEGKRLRAEWENTISDSERKRAERIYEIAAAIGEPDWTKVREWQASKKPIDEISLEAMAIVKDRASKKPTVGNGKPAVELNEKERKQYSMQRAVQLLVAEIDEPHRASKESSFEREISQELDKSFPDINGIKRHGGLLVPTFTCRETVLEAQYNLPNGTLTRAGLDSATSTKGVELKFTVPGEFLALLRNFMATRAAGVTVMGGLQGPVAFPSQTAAGTASWVAENPGSDVSDTNLLLAQIALNPKSLTSSTSYSRQLIAQAVIDVDGMVRSDLAQISAIALDLAVINGPGTNAPTGILGTSGIGSVAGGTNGLTPTYTHLVDLESAVTTANADQWPLSYMAHPTTRGTFKKATALSNTAGLPVWSKGDVALGTGALAGGGSRIPGELNGYPAWSSAQVPNNLTKGSSSGICLAILFGAFSQAVIGDWGMMEIIVDPYRLKKQGMIELTSFAMYGFAVKYAAGFAAMKDALA